MLYKFDKYSCPDSKVASCLSVLLDHKVARRIVFAYIHENYFVTDDIQLKIKSTKFCEALAKCFSYTIPFTYAR